MTDLVDLARAYCGCCWIERIQDEGCRLYLPQRRARLAIRRGELHQEHHAHSGKLSDFQIFMADPADGVVASIELKGRSPDARRVLRQIQAGAAVIEEVLGTEPVGKFRAILAHRGLNPNDARMLRRASVRFRGNPHAIRPVRCNTDLLAALR